MSSGILIKFILFFFFNECTKNANFVTQKKSNPNPYKKKNKNKKKFMNESY